MLWRALPPPPWWNDQSIEDAEVRLEIAELGEAAAHPDGHDPGPLQGSQDSARWTTRVLEVDADYPRMCTCSGAKLLQSKEHDIVGDGDWGVLFQSAVKLEWPQANDHFLIDPTWGENPMFINIMSMYLNGHPWLREYGTASNGLGLKAMEAWEQIEMWVLTAFRDHLSAVAGKMKKRREAASDITYKMISIASTVALSGWTFLLHYLQKEQSHFPHLPGIGNSTIGI